MKVIDCSFESIPETFDGVLLLGTFDGVHKGHIALVKEALNHTDSVGALLFKNNPADIFEKDKEHYVLTPLEDKIRRFANDGVETLYVIDNDESFYKHSKEEFIDFLHRLGVRRLCVGEDFTFGYQRSGHASDLSKEFLTFIVPLFSIDGKKVATRQVFEYLKDEDIISGKGLIDLPSVELTDEQEWKAKNGQTLSFEVKEDKVLLIKSNSLIAVYKRKNENTFVPERGLF